MVDILLSTYNGEKYLGELLDSILNQTYQDFQIIIRDDGSKDQTIALIEKYQEKTKKIQLIKGLNLGACHSFLELCKLAKNDYIMFCDQDDVWLNNKIEKEILKIQEYDQNRPIMVFSDLIVVDENLQTINKSFMSANYLDVNKLSFENLLVQNKIPGCSCLVNKVLIDKLKYIDSKRIRMHDQYLALIASKFGQIIYLNEPLILYRQTSNNVVGSNTLNYLAYFNKTIKRLMKMLKNKELFFDPARKQAAMFYETYQNELSEKDLIGLKAFFDKKHYLKSIYTAIKYL